MSAFLPSPFLGRPLSPPAAPHSHPPRPRPPTPTARLPDVVIIGAGPAGLSTAHELLHRGATVTLLSTSHHPPAGLAAAGMLAPFSESIPAPLRTLCHHSRALYPSFISRLHAQSNIDPRYVSRADFLLPLLHGQQPRHPPPPASLPAPDPRLIEPALGPRVSSVRRVPADAHVDNRLLMAALRATCETLGAHVRDHTLVRRLVVAPNGTSLDAVVTDNGEHVRAGHFILASGAWSRHLLPALPVRPVKGQMLALRPLPGESERLNHVLYGQDVYIVPKHDGAEFYVGATVEEGTFSLHNTAGGVAKLLNAAVELVPALADYEITETWSGLRPATPDLQPVLGMSEFDNLSIATGYYRNGILLAPATAKIAAATALSETSELPRELRDLIPKFSIARFLGKDSLSSQRRSQSVSASSPVQSNRDVVQPRQSETAAPTPENSHPIDLSEIKVWRVLPDGTREPVLPANRSYSTQKEPEQQPVQPAAPTKSKVPLSDLPQQPDKPQNYKTDGPALGNVSGKNDAYEDIMQHRDDAERIMSEAMAANRAFGRQKSSLEKDGGPVLSLSEEDVIRFDAAFEQGLQDVRDAENSYDENHPSVIATNAEKARMSQTQENNTYGLNGVSMPVAGGDKSFGDTAEQSGGYY